MEQTMSAARDLDKSSGKRFPILLGDQRSVWRGLPDSIPWELIEAHERQAHANHGHSIYTLAQRGGLSPYELLAVLLDQAFWRCNLPEPTTVIKKLKESIAGFDARHGIRDVILPALPNEAATGLSDSKQ
jgi:hypothetical protein